MVMEWYGWGAIMFGGLLFLLMIGIPVGFSLFVAATASLILVGGGLQLLPDLPGYFFHHLNSFTLTSVPLFILMALYSYAAGFGEDLFKSMALWLRRLPGSLNTVGIVSCAVFSAISGTSVATAATVSLVALPELRRYKYERRLAVGALASGGALGILIPPSVPMIMYCIVTGQSIGHMFAGGILPGIMTAGIFVVYVIIRCKLNPELAPVPPSESIGNLSRLKAVANVVPILAVILLVLVSIYFGIATPTEGAAVGAVGAAVLGLLYKRLTPAGIFQATLEGTKVGAFLILIFLGALAFGHAAVRAGVAQGLSDFVVHLGIPKYAVLAIILSTLFLLGFFMDPTPIILTTMPVLYPLAMKIGLDPIFFGVISVMVLETAAITPPVGFNLFVIHGLAKGEVTMGDIIRGSSPFAALYILSVIIAAAYPGIITFLPSLMSR